MWTILSINWTGQSVTSEQLLVLRNVAALHLQQGRKDPVLTFSHELCEGQIIRGEEGIFGAFPGTFFEADLGLVKGERWTVKFLLPRGSERIAVNDDCLVVSTRMLSGDAGITERVGHHAANVSGSTSVH